MLPRGGVSAGFINIEERHTAPNLTKDFIVSPALVHSAKLEASVKGSRLLVAIKKDDNHQLDNIKWNSQINCELYNNSSIDVWKDYIYKDALWFFDVKKEHVEAKNELLQLIKIAIKLVKKNAKKKAFIDQHIYTLRIGLLSYSRFIGLERDEILDSIILELHDDQYWLIWLTVIEIIGSTGNGWKYAAVPQIVDFYMKSSLKIGWIKVIEEINKPGQENLKISFEGFLNELSIRSPE